MANKKISELKVNSSPSTSTTLVGVDNGETVQIPIDVIQGSPFPCLTFDMEGNATTIADLITALTETGINPTEAFMLNLRGMRSGTYYCKFNSYGGTTYNVNFIDFITFSMYSTTGSSSSISISNVISDDCKIVDLINHTHDDYATKQYVEEVILGGMW